MPATSAEAEVEVAKQSSVEEVPARLELMAATNYWQHGCEVPSLLLVLYKYLLLERITYD